MSVRTAIWPVLILILISLNVDSVEGQIPENELPEPYKTRIILKDYNTGEWYADALGENSLSFLVPLDDDALSIYVEISSPQLFKIEADLRNYKFYITCSGSSGTPGYFILKIPARFVSPEAVRIEMDNRLISFDVENEEIKAPELVAEYFPEAAKVFYGEHVVFYAQYTFSTHFITITFRQAGTPSYTQPWYSRSLNLAAIALAIVAVLGALYWLGFRRST